jgi:hypothetical protein
MDTFRAALMAPGQQQKIFVVNSYSTLTHQHQYLHVNTGRSQGTRLHVGWNPDTTSAFACLTDAGQKVHGGLSRFTMDDLTVIGEYETWSTNAAYYARLGLTTPANSVVWSTPAQIAATTTMGQVITAEGSPMADVFGAASWFDTASTAMDMLDLPGMEGMIVYTPDVTATVTQWEHLTLPHTRTSTSGPGILVIAWIRSLEVFGKIIHRPERPRRVAGEERLKGQYRDTNSAWIRRPQDIFGLSTQRQIEA